MCIRLRHLHLPSIHPHYIPYSLASRVQEHVRRQHLDFKDGQQPSPPPTLISFAPSPIYTLGRRQTAPLTPAEAARLTAPLTIIPPPPLPAPANAHPSPPGSAVVVRSPSVLRSPRGGLTTYHGPGQAVLWPVLDLRSRQHHNYGVKCYARLLEQTTISTLGALFGLDAFTTADPGVWVRLGPPADGHARGGGEPGEPAEGGAGAPVAKIAALGVHLRRHVTALGTALNISVGFPPAAGLPPGTDEEGWNPWARIVACGLEGKSVASVAGRLGGSEKVDEMLVGSGKWVVRESRERMVSDAWAEELARRIGLEGVEVVDREEVVGLMARLAHEGGQYGDGTGTGTGTAGEEGVYVERMREAFRGR